MGDKIQHQLIDPGAHKLCRLKKEAKKLINFWLDSRQQWLLKRSAWMNRDSRAVDGLGVQQGPRFFQAFCRRLFVVSSLLVIAREREGGAC